MVSLGKVADLERLVGSLSGEVALVEAGKDEGLVPLYTLLGELEELLTEDSVAITTLNQARDVLGSILDKGGYFDEPSVVAIGDYIEKVQCFLRYYRMGETISWEQLESQWQTNLSSPSLSQSSAGSSESPQSSDEDPNDQLMVLDLDESMEVLEEFHQEAIEHLDNIEAALLDLENDPKDVDAISSVFRSFHTIKGVAGFLDLVPIRVLSHEIETLLDLVRSDKMDLDESVVSLVLESRDRLQLLINQVQEGIQNGTQPSEIIVVSDLIHRTVQMMAGNKPPAPGSVEVSASAAFDLETPAEPKSGSSFFEEAEPQASEAETAASSFEGAENEEEKSDSVDEEAEVLEAVAAAVSKKSASGKGKMAAASIRMNTEKLDSIIDAVGELVIVESQLKDSILSMGGLGSRIERNLAQLGRITRELQRSGLSLRMVSVKQLFQKMQRLARDLSSKSGKKVNFRVEGEETEMDRTVVEKIGDPLVHMIRNSMDHGIEPPQERIAAGKNEVGEVLLRAYYQGDNIVLELTDDGRGVNSERVLKKAIERGLAQEGKNYTREEIISFIFLPGFSTAAKVSDISGRGVGMDVVRSNVQNLRGRIDMQSDEGKGSVLRISLPLTMAIIDGLLIRVGKERYILPVMCVNMTLKPVPEQIFSVKGQGLVIKHREKIYRLVNLGHFFGVDIDAQKPEQGVVVMVETDGEWYGLIVDEIMHKQEVVVKNLGGTDIHPEGVSGGAILGDGTISLILDPTELIRGRT